MILIVSSLSMRVIAASDAANVSSIVHVLGETNEQIADDLDRLAADRHTAVKLLVAELHVIPPKVYYERTKTLDSRHIIACLWALRYLTGTTFTAATKSRLTDDQKQFLDFKNEMHDQNPSHELHFFGVWMSRNADFVAPRDAQVKIIQQWKQWAARNADTFQYKPPANAGASFDQWVWFG